MTLLKYLTACFAIPNKLPDFSFFDLRRRLIIAYLLVMSTVLGISGTALYIFFAQSLNHQLNNRLQTLVQAATPSLNTIKLKGRQSLDQDLSWRELFFNRQQSLEWFDVNGKLIAREGGNFPRVPLSKEVFSTLHNGEFILQQERQTRSIIIAVYTTKNRKNIQLRGYIRASESVEEIETVLKQLQLGLWLGGATAISLIGISSVYLTRQALNPTLKSFRHLKQFAADASHELGGPLTKISFASEILLSNPEQLSKPSARKKIEIIKNGAEQMKHLLEDLLFLSRTDAISPLIKPEKAIVFVDELLEQLAEHFGEVAHNQEIDFKTNIQPDLVVKGDISQLNRLFSNILTNAFKYTHAGGKIILSSSLSQKNVVVSVEDTGIGIDSQYLPFIFQRFWRAKQVSKQKGLGLGLAISQTIVQQHQGKITVSSTVNVGTCFKISLPSHRLPTK
jgi:two-component system, OmpR family, manganese sensing sensor histidine kinase